MNQKISAIIFIILGIFLFLCYYLLKKKHKISILREFMYKDIKKKQLNKFCEDMSYVFFFLAIGTLIIGISYFGDFVNIGSIVLVIAFLVSAYTYKKVQNKYRFKKTK